MPEEPADLAEADDGSRGDADADSAADADAGSQPDADSDSRSRAAAGADGDHQGEADSDPRGDGDGESGGHQGGPGLPDGTDAEPGAEPGEPEPGAGANGRPLPEATIARLPVYLRALYTLAERGTGTVASDELAAAAGVNSAKLRKDLSHLGSYGIRGVGYDVDYLVYQVSRALGLTQKWPVVIVGGGNLGRALANYGGFMNRGFKISAILDSNEELVGREIGEVTVRHVGDLEDVVQHSKAAIGVIAVPADSAQAVCDRLVGAGVTSILNFAPLVLNVPEGVDVRKVDLSIELQILAFHAQRRSAERFGQVPGPAAAVEAQAVEA